MGLQQDRAQTPDQYLWGRESFEYLAAAVASRVNTGHVMCHMVHRNQYSVNSAKLHVPRGLAQIISAINRQLGKP